jgi:hypothetical protein
LIYAYGLTDPDESEISYHVSRRGTRMIPLQSYNQPPSDQKLVDLDYFDIRLNNVSSRIQLNIWNKINFF